MLRQFIVFGLISVLFGAIPGAARSASQHQRAEFQRSIIDYRHQANRHFSKRPRRSTKYIIVHTAEGELKNTLRVVAKGKTTKRGRRTLGGHSHYVIARDGRTYRILDKKYRADHAGQSMWNRQKNLSDVSIGIELVGYHHRQITKAQYESVALLLDILKRIYKLNDNAILTHSQIAYGGPNRWFKRSHRGRKRCAKNFDRSKAHLHPTWKHDPDVRSGALQPDPELAELYYGAKRQRARSTNVITRRTTAWMIAGEDYNSSKTMYKFPNGKVLQGDRVAHSIGWRRVPRGTQVFLNTPGNRSNNKDLSQSLIGVIKDGATAQILAGEAYRLESTKYIFPNGTLKHGGEIVNWEALPTKTRVIVGYRGPFEVTAARPPIKIAGNNYRSNKVIYYFPDHRLVAGTKIRNFRRLPSGVQMFLPDKKVVLSKLRVSR